MFFMISLIFLAFFSISLFFGLLAFISTKMQISVLILCLVSLFCWIFYKIIAFLLEKISDPIDTYFANRNLEKINREPCKHGVFYAKLSPDKCQKCQTEIYEKNEMQRIQREQERMKSENERYLRESKAKELAAKKLLERQKAWTSYVKRIRLPEFLKTIDPREFEELIGNLYRAQGYSVEITKYSNDGGIDAYLRKNGSLILLQCKRYKGTVGEPAIRDLLGNVTKKRASQGLLVTTGKVSRQAKEWIHGFPLKIIELDELVGMIRTYLNEDTIIPAGFHIAEPVSIKSLKNNTLGKCPTCGAELRRVKGSYGSFIGCTMYPQCRYTRNST